MLKKKVFPHFINGLLFAVVVSSASASDVASVDVYRAKASSQQQTLTLTGTVEAKHNADLAPLQSGVVAQLFVEIGDQVEQGQKLMALDAKLAQLSLSQTKATKAAALSQQKEAQRRYDEIVELSKKQLVAQSLLAERWSAVEIATANFNQVTAQLKQQQEVLSRHILYAPFAGVIAKRQIDVGEWVTQQTPVFTLVAQNDLRLNIAIPQEYYAQLAHASKQKIAVTVIPDLTEGLSFKAQLNRIVAVANNTSRTVTGLVDLPQRANLVAGGSATAKVKLPTKSQAVVWLPKTAIKQHPDGGNSVFTLENDSVKRALVTVIKTQGQQVAITGVDASSAFVISGVELLKDGDVVKVNRTEGGKL